MSDELAKLSLALSYPGPGGESRKVPSTLLEAPFQAINVGRIDIPDGALDGAPLVIPFGAIGVGASLLLIKNGNNQDMALLLAGATEEHCRIPPGGVFLIGGSVPSSNALTEATLLLTADQDGDGTVDYWVFGDSGNQDPSSAGLSLLDAVLAAFGSTSAPPNFASASVKGTAERFAREDHTHGTPSAIATTTVTSTLLTSPANVELGVAAGTQSNGSGGVIDISLGKLGTSGPGIDRSGAVVLKHPDVSTVIDIQCFGAHGTPDTGLYLRIALPISMLEQVTGAPGTYRAIESVNGADIVIALDHVSSSFVARDSASVERLKLTQNGVSLNGAPESGQANALRLGKVAGAPSSNPTNGGFIYTLDGSDFTTRRPGSTAYMDGFFQSIRSSVDCRVQGTTITMGDGAVDVCVFNATATNTVGQISTSLSNGLQCACTPQIELLSGTYVAVSAPIFYSRDATLTNYGFAANNGTGVCTLGFGTPIHAINCSTQTTVGAAGGASALPATPTGYMRVSINGTTRKIPYYAD